MFRRLLVTLCISIAIGLLLGWGWKSGIASFLLRTVLLGVVATIVFTVIERWPTRLPSWCARWVIQVLGVGFAMPIATFVIYRLSTAQGAHPFWLDQERLEGFVLLTFLGVLLAPWTALGALVRQKEALARHQALAFDLERSELERRALTARSTG